VALGASLAGCGTQPSRLRAQYLDSSDACMSQRAAIIQEEDNRSQQITSSAAVGAATGAFLGAVVGGLTADRRHRGQGIATGAGVGLLAGGLTGLAAGYMQAANNDRARAFALLSTDSQKQYGAISALSGSADALRNCRAAQVRTVGRDAAVRRISRSEADLRLQQLLQRNQEDTELISSVFGVVDRRNQELVNAAAQLRNQPEYVIKSAPTQQAALVRDTDRAKVKTAEADQSMTDLITRTRSAIAVERSDLAPRVLDYQTTLLA
jgi:hypothetical protein